MLKNLRQHHVLLVLFTYTPLSTMRLWRFDVASNNNNNNTYLGIHVNTRYFCPIWPKFRFSLTDFHKTQTSNNPSSRSPADLCGQTEGYSNMTKLTVLSASTQTPLNMKFETPTKNVDSSLLALSHNDVQLFERNTLYC